MRGERRKRGGRKEGKKRRKRMSEKRERGGRKKLMRGRGRGEEKRELKSSRDERF